MKGTGPYQSVTGFWTETSAQRTAFASVPLRTRPVAAPPRSAAVKRLGPDTPGRLADRRPLKRVTDGTR
jgi:hypothetical protein